MLPCGQCIGCRLEYSRQWAIRCVHESQMHEKNSFITLTYANENLPQHGSLSKRHLQLFIKRLRAELSQKKIYIRFFACGEYGEKLHRPHYHLCIFNYDFPDKRLHQESTTGHNLYTSAELQKIWGYGFSTVGSLTFETAAYTARYIMKKITGPPAEDHYEFIHPETGEIKKLTSEFSSMSKIPGLGNSWYQKFKNDVYPSDQIIMNQKIMRPPRYYDKLFELDNPEKMAEIKMQRQERALLHEDDLTEDRLKIREEVQTLRTKNLTRSLENDP